MSLWLKEKAFMTGSWLPEIIYFNFLENWAYNIEFTGSGVVIEKFLVAEFVYDGMHCNIPYISLYSNSLWLIQSDFNE